MRRVVGLVVLSVCLAVVGGAALSPTVDAQDKTKTKAKDKKDAAAPGTVEIYKAKDGGYRFRIKDPDGKLLAIPSRSRESKEDVAKDLEEIKLTLEKAKPTDVKE
jgi:uncharacterized protein YegP (UPF0339 family)